MGRYSNQIKLIPVIPPYLFKTKKIVIKYDLFSETTSLEKEVVQELTNIKTSSNKVICNENLNYASIYNRPYKLLNYCKQSRQLRKLSCLLLSACLEEINK